MVRRLHLARDTADGRPARALAGIRPIKPSDASALAALMIDAYRGTTDDGGESDDEALQEVERSFRGAYGRFVPSGSWAVEQGGVIQSAVMVTMFEGLPLFAFCMTRADRKRHGLCVNLMRISLDALARAGFSRAHLFVTAANAPAVALYRKLGFAEEESIVENS